MAAYKTPPCPMCGVWECLDCGVRTGQRNRYYPGKHHCRTCRSFTGRMLDVHHRPDIYESHAADVDPQDTCHYPLDINEPTTAPTGQKCPTGRNPMSTRTWTVIDIELELEPSDWEPLPDLPATLGTPTVDWSYNDLGKLETDITLLINNNLETVSFWDWDPDGVVSTAEDTGEEDPWGDLAPEHREAALEWGKEVHRRVCAGAEALVQQAAPHGSDAYRAIVAYASSSASGEGVS